MLTRDEAEVVLFTFEAAALATILILPPGLAAALALARYQGPGKGAIETVLSLPLILPPTAVGLLLLEAFSRRSPLGAGLAAHGIEVVFTWKAVVLATAVMSFPLLVRSARTAFEGVDSALIWWATHDTLAHAYTIAWSTDDGEKLGDDVVAVRSLEARFGTPVEAGSSA